MLPIDQVRLDLPRSYLRKLAAGLVGAYRRAQDESERLFVDVHVRYNHAPWIRRGLLEDYILASGQDGVAVVNVPSKYFWSHAEVHAGSTVLTQATCYPGEPLRRAEYREALSRQNSLFGEDHEPLAPYAVLLHSRLGGDASKVGYAVLRCALPGMKGWFDGGINLIHDFPDVFGFRSDDDIEQIDDDAFPDFLDDEETGT